MSTSHPPDIIHVMNAPRPSQSSALVYYCERKQKVKGGLGMRLEHPIAVFQAAHDEISLVFPLLLPYSLQYLLLYVSMEGEGQGDLVMCGSVMM